MSQVPKSYKLPLFESFCRKTQVDGLTIDAKIDSFPLKLKVASTPESQAKGFMDSDPPGDDTGILFIYDLPEPLQFWMKGVSFSLDIAFFDDAKRYLGHQTMDQTDEVDDFKIPRYSSDHPARYAVELKAGWCKDRLHKGSRLHF